MFYKTAASVQLSTRQILHLNKAQEFFLHGYIISCCTELHETCTKHKRRKLRTFLACPLLASSNRNADLGEMDQASVFVWQF